MFLIDFAFCKLIKQKIYMQRGIYAKTELVRIKGVLVYNHFRKRWRVLVRGQCGGSIVS